MNIKTGFWGFVLGGLIGATVTLLYAPQSGDETRHILAENSQKMKESALDSIQEAQEVALSKLNQTQIHLDTLNKETKELLGQLQTVGKTTVEGQKEVLEEGYEQVKEAVAA